MVAIPPISLTGGDALSSAEQGPTTVQFSTGPFSLRGPAAASTGGQDAAGDAALSGASSTGGLSAWTVGALALAAFLIMRRS